MRIDKLGGLSYKARKFLVPEDKNLLFKEHVLEPRLLLDLQNGRAESFLVNKVGNLKFFH